MARCHGRPAATPLSGGGGGWRLPPPIVAGSVSVDFWSPRVVCRSAQVVPLRAPSGAWLVGLAPSMLRCSALPGLWLRVAFVGKLVRCASCGRFWRRMGRAAAPGASRRWLVASQEYFRCGRPPGFALARSRPAARGALQVVSDGGGVATVVVEALGAGSSRVEVLTHRHLRMSVSVWQPHWADLEAGVRTWLVGTARGSLGLECLTEVGLFDRPLGWAQAALCSRS